MKPTQQDISRIIPNTFPFPNFYIDSGIWALLKPTEQSCLVIIARKTYGWWKQSDRIALSQIVELTGLCEGTVRKTMQRLVSFGIVTLVSASNGVAKEWALQVEDQLVDYVALRCREDAKKALNMKRTGNQTPVVGQHPSPIVPQHPSPSVGQHPQNHNKPKKTYKPSPSKLFQDAVATHFKITLNPSFKAHLSFLKWAVDEAKITPEMVEYAAQMWEQSPELNWHGKRPLKGMSIITFQQEWLKMIEGYGSQPQDDNPFDFALVRMT